MLSGTQVHHLLGLPALSGIKPLSLVPTTRLLIYWPHCVVSRASLDWVTELHALQSLDPTSAVAMGHL